MSSLATRLYRGQVDYDFIARRRRWYAISAALLLVSLLSLAIRGLNLGIDFTGGGQFEFTAREASVTEVTETVEGAGVKAPVVQKIGNDLVRVQTRPLEQPEVDKVSKAIQDKYRVPAVDLNPTTVGPKWGAEISRRALYGLGAFLLLVVAYISLRFEPKMAVAGLAALAHDLLITAGIYALVGFAVTPSTVIALLTILGYSLYDTVVVFDKVRENTVGLAGGSRMSYSQAANLAINQTLMRSINTSLTSLLPVGALLFVGVGLLGAGTLEDLSLALFIGLAASTYSSIFVAIPLLTELKEREPQFRSLAARVASRQAGAGGRLATAGAPVPVGAGRATRALGGPQPAPAAADNQPGGDGASSTDSGRPPSPAPAGKGQGGGAGRPAARAQARPAKRKGKGGRGGRPGGKKRR